MKILTGRHAGKTGRPHQWANDWITVDFDGGGNGVVGPGHVELDADEIERFRASRFDRSIGSFWRDWKLNEGGTFTAMEGARRDGQ